MIAFEDTQKPAPFDVRKAYLDALPEPQEFYIEGRVARGRLIRITDDGAAAGHAVIDAGGKTLLEFYLDNAHLRESEAIYAALVKQFKIRRLLCKSFDPYMLYPALRKKRKPRPSGYLFRHIADDSFQEREGVHVRPARGEDVDALLSISGGFFDDGAEIDLYLADDQGLIFIFEEERTNGLIGCGISKPVLPTGTAMDIGMLVAPAYRRQGFGSYIVSYLKSHLLGRGLRPVCGCASDNAGSKRALERGGFASLYRIIEFKA